jgi:uncharacterized delta-60 repeat protein
MRATTAVFEQLEERRLFSTAGSIDFTTIDPIAQNGNAVAVQSTGNIVVLATSGSSSSIVRYDSTGDLNSATSTPIGFRASAMKLQGDKIVVAGELGGDFIVKRFTANGSLDTVFGSNGQETIDFQFDDGLGSGMMSGEDTATALAIDDVNNTIVVAGHSSFDAGHDMSVAVLGADGDASGSAVVTKDAADTGNGWIDANDAAVRNGTIVVAGSASDLDSWAVEKFDANGTFQHATTFPSGLAYSVAIASNDDIILGGASDETGDYLPTVLRISSISGTVTNESLVDFGQTVLPGADGQVSDVAIQPLDGKIVAVGMITDELGVYRAGVARLTSSGGYDTQFGTGGSTVIAPEHETFGRGVALQTGGKILFSGDVVDSGSVLLARVEGVTTASNTPPIMDSVTITPSNPTTNTLLTANPSAHDADGDIITYTYQWSKNGIAIGGATGSTLDLSQAGNGDRGDSITVTVTPHDAAAGAPLTSDPSIVENTAPLANAGADKTADQYVAVSFSAALSSDADGDPLTYTWDFGDGFTGSGVSPSHTYATATNGVPFVVTVTVSDGHGGTNTDQLNVTVLSPEQQIDQIISQIEQLQYDNQLNSGNTNSLMTKLDGAAAKLDQDQYNVAMNKIESFINQVNGWISDGKISASIGQTMINEANDVLASIQGGMNA